ncbi:alpha/beta hydrolase [Pelagicoccus albus]|uniref:Alpha/beta hydrolase n=1 Tax=Pelagicoccus albus TaxID=415222 RepID=A0A7X1BA02_9BACT|nr:alpha/beta hydrolase [Pelagicoccus albus]MBC2607080.1 alpha/beta hydrolase [Pelagicoccus albus]
MKRPLALIPILLASLLIQIASAQSAAYRDVLDVPYFSESNPDPYTQEKALLDIHYPEANELAPVIIWFHGGGLTGGQREIPAALREKGFVIVAPSYRLSPKVKAADCIVDATTAVAWTIKNIERYHGDPSKVFVSGHSAGGYLAMMSVIDKNRLGDHGIDANSIAGLIPFSGHTITHFTVRAERGISGKQPIIDEFAPLYYVRPDAPPTLLITGDRELEMLGRYEENAYFYRMMKVAGHEDINLYEMDGYGHGMTEPAFPLLLKFVSEKADG